MLLRRLHSSRCTRPFSRQETKRLPRRRQTQTDAEIEKFLPLLKDYLNRAFVVALVRLLLTISDGSGRVCPSARLWQGGQGRRQHGGRLRVRCFLPSPDDGPGPLSLRSWVEHRQIVSVAFFPLSIRSRSNP